MSNLFVLGMHRSGTSAVAGALVASGFYPGRELLPADPGFNDRGFYENKAVVAIHDEFFDAFGLDWRYCYQLPPDCFESEAAELARNKIKQLLDGEYSTNQPWCIKDPRVSVLFPLWRRVLDETKIEYKAVLTQRDPGAVAASLARRDGLSINQGLLLWLYYSLAAEFYTRGVDRAVVLYDDFVRDPGLQLGRLLEALGLGLRRIPTSNELGVDVGLRHVGREESNCPELFLELFESLRQVPAPTQQIDAIRNPLWSAFPLLPDMVGLERIADSRAKDLETTSLHVQNLEQLIERGKEDNRKSIEHAKNLENALSDALETNVSLKKTVTTLEEMQRAAESKAQQMTVELAHARTEADRANEAFNAIRLSLFWRLTRPARYIVERARRLRRLRARTDHQIALKPEKQVQLDKGWYVSTGEEAHLLLVTDQNYLPSGNVELTYLLEEGSCELNPILHVNYGFEEGQVEFSMPTPTPGLNRIKLSMPDHTNCLRLDPLTTKGKFNITDFKIRELF
tara:strand:- start:6980 stop:8515 length:1536 start_codon:yes stop_codon:yes gene_type:complete